MEILHAVTHESPERRTRVEGNAEDERASLVGRLACRDEGALARLYDETSPMVYGLALRVLKDPHAAEEATLDVYLQVWRQAGTFDPARGNVTAWLLMLARSRSIDRLRSRTRGERRNEPLTAAEILPDEGPSPDETADRAIRKRRIASALERLAPEQRDLIVTAFFTGLSHSEIAAETGLPLGTVKTRIRLGMTKLREILAGENE